MKKILKIFLVNFFVIFIILFFTELYFFSLKQIKIQDTIKKTAEYAQKYEFENQKIENLSFPKFIQRYIEIYTFILMNKDTIYDNNMRNPSYAENSSKLPVVLLGCSYTYGNNLPETQTFSSVLSKLTNRTVYNLGIAGASPKEMLYILRDNKKINQLLDGNENIQFFIYTYIDDQRRRLYSKFLCQTPVFKPFKKNGVNYLRYIKPNLIRNTYIYNHISDSYYLFINKFSPSKTYDLFCLYMKEIQREINKKYKYIDAQGNEKLPVMVLLVYDGFDEHLLQLEQDGIIVINLNDYINLKAQEYSFPDGHPNYTAWKSITPYIIQQLHL